VSATVTFSVEIELGWGLVQYDRLNALTADRKAETVALDRLLNLCDELEIPITFNIVGHLLRDRPLSSYEGPHEPGWFDDIPKTGIDSDPQFYAPDLVDRILAASVNHEICTHTFTHVEAGNVSRETLRWELDHVFEAHSDYRLDQPVSIVPPRHSPPPRDVLREYDFEIVRSPRSRAPNHRQPSNHLQLGKDILTGAQPIVPPQMVDDVVETYSTTYPSLTAPFLRSGQQEPHPAFKTVPLPVRKKLHLRNMRAALSEAIEQNLFVHLWTHLWETANNIQWKQIKQFFVDVERMQASDQIVIQTMERLNKAVRKQ